MALERWKRAESGWDSRTGLSSAGSGHRESVVTCRIGPPALQPEPGRGELLLERLAAELRAHLGAQLLALGEVHLDAQRPHVRAHRPPGPQADVHPLAP